MLARYDLRSKYLSIQNEPRIRRYQFFVRLLIPTILMVLTIYVVNLLFLRGSLAVSLDSLLIISLTMPLFLYIFSLISIPRLITKRCHDIGKN